MVTLKYKDETDRAYGLGGMAVGMVVWDCEQYLTCVSLDAEADSGIEFSRQFFHAKNQKLSAKAVWADELEHFQLVTGLTIANLLSRALVRNREDVSRELREVLLKNLVDEGHESCGLENDEVRALFDKNYNHLKSIFSHPTVGNIVDDLASRLIDSRTLDRDTVLEILRPLMRL